MTPSHSCCCVVIFVCLHQGFWRYTLAVQSLLVIFALIILARFVLFWPLTTKCICFRIYGMCLPPHISVCKSTITPAFAQTQQQKTERDGLCLWSRIGDWCMWYCGGGGYIPFHWLPIHQGSVYRCGGWQAAQKRTRPSNRAPLHSHHSSPSRLWTLGNLF